MPSFTKPQFSKKIVVSVSAAALVALGAGTAYAYWSTTGSGSGSAGVASSNGTLSLHASFASGLTPGASEDVAYTADNPGTSSLQVGTITPTVSVDAAHASAGCLASDFSISPTVSNTTVPAHGTAVAVGTGTLTFTDSSANQDGCKGATITLTLAS